MVLPANVAVSVVIVGTGLALMLSVLVAAALLNEVIMPELLRLTMPAALFVIPAIVPVPFKLMIPVLVKLARMVEIAPPLVLVMVAVPAFVSVVMEQVPPIFKVRVAYWLVRPCR